VDWHGCDYNGINSTFFVLGYIKKKLVIPTPTRPAKIAKNYWTVGHGLYCTHNPNP